MMCWDINAMLWDVYAMLWENEMNGLMICCAMVCYEIWTKLPPYTEGYPWTNCKRQKPGREITQVSIPLSEYLINCNLHSLVQFL